MLLLVDHLARMVRLGIEPFSANGSVPFGCREIEGKENDQMHYSTKELQHLVHTNFSTKLNYLVRNGNEKSKHPKSNLVAYFWLENVAKNSSAGSVKVQYSISVF